MIAISTVTCVIFKYCIFKDLFYKTEENGWRVVITVNIANKCSAKNIQFDMVIIKTMLLFYNPFIANLSALPHT